MNDFFIGCKCGHRDAMEAFEHDAAGEPLPPGEYHCHACGCDWGLVATGKARLMDNGLWIPPRQQVVER